MGNETWNNNWKIWQAIDKIVLEFVAAIKMIGKMFTIKCPYEAGSLNEDAVIIE